ncbi:hypothetical protein OF83DRAFT_1083058 [Amylostereum chailletii]|nr:hypothetical protein OF83DRAFT_1083058 [Amylostereum chailletii]
MYLITEVSLLSLMLVGLVRARTTRSTGLWEMLYHQGWIWLLLALVAEVPTLVLIALNLNGEDTYYTWIYMSYKPRQDCWCNPDVQITFDQCPSGSRRLQDGMASATTVRAGGSQIPDYLPKSSSTRAVEVEVYMSTEVQDGEGGPGPRNGATGV